MDCLAPQINSDEAFKRAKERRASKPIAIAERKVPKVAGHVAAKLVIRMKEMDAFKAQSLSKNGKKVIR